MLDDPIVDEIRRIREDFARKFNYDLDAMAAYLRERGKRHPERLVYSSPIRPRQGAVAQEAHEDYNEG